MAQQQQQVDIPDEFKAKMNEWMEEYQTTGGSLQDFLEKKSIEQQEEEDRKRREQEQQSKESNQNFTRMVFSGAAYLKDLAKQVGEDQRDDQTKAKEIQQNMSKEGQQVYQYKGDKDAGTHDMDVTKKDNNFFKSSTDPNDFNFNRSSPQGLDGKSFEASGLTPDAKQQTVDQINRVEDKTFGDIAKNHPELDYAKKQDGNTIEHSFKNKDGSDLTSQQQSGIKQEFFQKAPGNAEKDAKQNNQEAPDVVEQKTNLPRPKMSSAKSPDDAEKLGPKTAGKAASSSSAPGAAESAEGVGEAASKIPVPRPK